MESAIVHCYLCKKKPFEIEEYLDLAEEDEITPEEYVVRHEGTFNDRTNRFCCTQCYIKIGMPTTPEGWKAP